MQGYGGTFPSFLVSSPQATTAGVQPPPYSPFSFTNWTPLAQANTAPTITTTDYSPLSRQQGTTNAVNSTIAKGSDKETSAGSLIVTATSVPAGIVVTSIVNTSGTVTANVAVDCAATLGDNTIVLEISDGALTSTANLIVNVTANTAPTLTYGSGAVVSAGSTIINAASGPSDNGTVQTIALQSAGTYTGGISVDNSTGQISISNAAPVGTHAITIRATDNCGAFTDSQFTLTVTDAPNVCTAVVSSGNWSATATWGCGHVPGPGDSITIPPGTNITLDIDPSGVSITVSAGAILTVLGNRTLLHNMIVNGTLNFSSGSQAAHSPLVSSNNNLITGNNVVSVSCEGVITGASPSGFVVGNLRKDFCASGAFTYPVGTIANGDEYTPVDVNITTLAITPSSLTVSANYGTAGPLLDNTSLDRYWTLTETGDLTADLTFSYLEGDVDGAERSYRLIRIAGGVAVSFPNQCPAAPCVDPNANLATFKGASSFSNWTLGQPAAPTATDGVVSGIITDANGTPIEGAAVRMDGSQNRLTVTDSFGRYRFDSVETNGLYTVTPSRANFVFGPSQRTFSQIGQSIDATFNATYTGASANPLDRTEYFVRQQYVDFLGREPDEAGLNFWCNNIESCGSNEDCRATKRIDTSAAFFLSIEFQQTGYFVFRLYQSAYGDLPGAPVPLTLGEFQPDTRTIGAGLVVGRDGWETLLDSNRRNFAESFVQRARFIEAYPTTMSPAEFVDRLCLNTAVGLEDSDRASIIREFGASANTNDSAARGRAILRIAESPALKQKEFNQAFVLMQYFGYLGRNPGDAPEQNRNFDGFAFWLTKLDQFKGNFTSAEMVKAFLLSSEYRGRFPR
jgi:hypothetical protein